MKQRSVRVKYFALLREERGVSSEQISTDAATAADLYRDLKREHGFSLSASRLRVAINDKFASWESALRTGDTVVFVPPVAGG